MELSPKTIADLFRDFFPVAAPDAPPLGSLLNVQPNYSRIREFAEYIAELGDDFSERSIALVVSTIQETFEEEQRNRLTDNYPLIPYGLKRTRPRTIKRERADWIQFLSEIRFALLRAIRPQQALFIKCIRGLSESDRAFVLDAFVREFSSPITVRQILEQMELIERGAGESCRGGGNHIGYCITFDRVEFENDGDGFFEEDEIIRVYLTFEEFRAALRDWETTLIAI